MFVFILFMGNCRSTTPNSRTSENAVETEQSEHIQESNLEFIPEPTLETISEPNLKPIQEPNLEPIPEPILKPILETIPEPILETIQEPNLEPKQDPKTAEQIVREEIYKLTLEKLQEWESKPEWYRYRSYTSTSNSISISISDSEDINYDTENSIHSTDTPSYCYYGHVPKIFTFECVFTDSGNKCPNIVYGDTMLCVIHQNYVIPNKTGSKID